MRLHATRKDTTPSINVRPVRVYDSDILTFMNTSHYLALQILLSQLLIWHIIRLGIAPNISERQTPIHARTEQNQ